MRLINGFNQCIENNFAFTLTHQRVLIMLNNWIHSLAKITLVLLCKLGKNNYVSKYFRELYIPCVKNCVTYMLHLFINTITQLQR